ncbi:hypothetical protein HKX48_003315 [Thoreauomyces humboldtii]|nr:hypothetical protein HKX48_003315 [Thoreauomyces humboldtii]
MEWEEYPEVAERIWEAYSGSHSDPPSVFQIRYGGAKGILVVDPAIAGERKILLRPSQVKFDHLSDELEIAGTSRRLLPAFLNHQAITLLSLVRGIPQEVFLRFQRRAVEELDCMLESELAAVDSIYQYFGTSSYSPTNFSGFSSGDDTSEPYGLRSGYLLPFILAKLQAAGFPFLADPMLRALVNTVRKGRLLEMKTKARIPVPDMDGRGTAFTLYGVLDESLQLYVLHPSSVVSVGFSSHFVFSTAELPMRSSIHLSNELHARHGSCVVLKFPALVPGDVMTLACNRNVPALSHLRNCIVFPGTGDRPIPSMLAGSDLDGDLYAVYFHPELVPRSANREPEDYASATPVTAQDITSFFIDFLRNDRLGQIANSHLAWADLEGPDSYQCRELASKNSIAVDFNKSGIPADFPRELSPRKYPDFMDKHNKPSYKSDKVLGKLFRAIDDSTDSEPAPPPALPTSAVSFLTRTTTRQSSQIWRI